MTDPAPPTPAAGDALEDRDGRLVGRVEAVFVDYVLVRTRGLMPIDLYVPMPEITARGADRRGVQLTRAEALKRWRRPLKRAPHAP